MQPYTSKVETCVDEENELPNISKEKHVHDNYSGVKLHFHTYLTGTDVQGCGYCSDELAILY